MDDLTLKVEFSEAAKAALAQLDSDVQALVGLVDEMVAMHARILSVVEGEIARSVGVTVGETVGVRVMADENGSNAPSAVPPLPEEMAARGDFHDNVAPDDRIRDTPFNRAPRSKQVEWLQQVMADGRWYTPIEIAKTVANDERHYRYLRHALAGRMREMHEDGLVERRDSSTRGAMFAYRLRPQEG